MTHGANQGDLLGAGGVQLSLEVGAEEGVDLMLEHHRFARQRLHLRMDVRTSAAGDEEGRVGTFEFMAYMDHLIALASLRGWARPTICGEKLTMSERCLE